MISFKKFTLQSVSVCICLCLSVADVYAQMSAEELRKEQQETIEELRRTEDISGNSNKLMGALARNTGWKFTFGGWYSPSFVSANDNDRDKKTQDILDHTWENELKYYFNIQSGTGKTKLYTRFGTKFTENSEVGSSIQSSDLIQPGLEMMYLEKSFGQKSLRQKLTMGRQYAKVKNTLAFGLVADGIGYEFKTRRQSGQFFFMRSLPGADNPDFLAPRAGRDKRWFAGAEYTVKYLPLQELNFFSVVNKDANDDKPDAEGQRHMRDSLFLGMTVFGTIFSRLEYELQVIKELGKTFSDTGNLAAQEVDIDAEAVYFGLKYYFFSSLKPVIHADYLYGSGDGDAVGNVSSTSGGSGSLTTSGAGGKDTRFIPFGGKNLGYALAPTATNLHTIKTGISLKPFGWAESRFWREIKFHPQYYLFRRDRGYGATSDPYMIRGSTGSKKVGSEIDLSLSWRLMSDVTYVLKFGRFSPGAAYPTGTAETFLRLKMSFDL